MASPLRFIWKKITGVLANLRSRRERILHQRAWIKFYSQFVGRGELCYDVGANVGRRTDALIALKARVIAIEPHPQCFEVLEARYRGNSAVTLVKKGLAATEGTTEFLVSNEIQTSSMSRDWTDAIKKRLPELAWEQVIQVEVTTLDILIQRYGTPKFCKIDVEGYESQVLKGLSQPIPVVSFEYTPEFIDSGVACIEKLESLGPYQYQYSREETLVFGMETWVDGSTMIQMLRSLPYGTSGDVYARLADER